jgi:hypothetical protein
MDVHAGDRPDQRGSAEVRQPEGPRRAVRSNPPGRPLRTHADRGASGAVPPERDRASTTPTSAASSSGVGVPRMTLIRGARSSEVDTARAYGGPARRVSHVPPNRE